MPIMLFNHLPELHTGQRLKVVELRLSQECGDSTFYILTYFDALVVYVTKAPGFTRQDN